MRRLLLLMLMLGWAGSAAAHPGYYNTAFHAHDVEQARELARSEHKRIFVAVTTPERDGWPVFRWPDARNRALVDLLVRETVIVELDTDRSRRELRWRESHTEALILLERDGRPLQEFPLDTPSAALQRLLERETSSPAGIARIEGAIADRGSGHFVSRERRAHALAGAGRTQEAIAEYEWCLDQAIEARSRAAQARRPHVWEGVDRLAGDSAAAAQLLESSRRRATDRVLEHPGERRLAHDLGRLNAMRGESGENARLFDRLPPESRARHGLVDSLLADLVSQGRYDEVLTLIDPMQAWQGEVEIYRRNRIRRPASAERGHGRGSRSFVLERGIALAEALAGQGDRARSRALLRAILEFEDSPHVRGRLAEAARRSGRAELLDAGQARRSRGAEVNP